MPTDKKIQKGEIVNIDFGVKYQDYVSDTQRIFYILNDEETEPPKEIQRCVEVVVNSIEQSKQAMCPNIQAFEIDAISRKVITENGYPEFKHGLGHQLGRFVHDGTALMGPLWEKYADKPLQKLEPNMVFTIEPKVTIPNRGHVSIEEMVVVTKNGCEWLTTPQKSIILISNKT
jgi:Xaa-Pro aminopeptidase